MKYKFNEVKIDIKVGDIVKNDHKIYMVCKYSKDIVLTDLSAGEILDYGYSDNPNDLTYDLDLELVCKNKDLLLTTIE